ncbi:MAG: fibronectin type III domain-containing protein [Planctomycetaceae bacterium]|nr:fibronectin type III domain-containing protein [Planctomycetaceae bacterium]
MQKLKPVDVFAGATSYNVYRYKNSVWGIIGTATKTTYIVKALTANVAYGFRVSAVNSQGESTLTDISKRRRR